MIRLRILQILDEQNHTKYWLYKRMDMLSYRNFKNIVENETSSIRFGASSLSLSKPALPLPAILCAGEPP